MQKYEHGVVTNEHAEVGARGISYLSVCPCYQNGLYDHAYHYLFGVVCPCRN